MVDETEHERARQFYGQFYVPPDPDDKYSQFIPGAEVINPAKMGRVSGPGDAYVVLHDLKDIRQEYEQTGIGQWLNERHKFYTYPGR